jgi:selenoprotein W-related protein
MTAVEIEYCVPCELLEPAVETQTRLLNEFGRDLEEVTLTPGYGGVFVVTADGEAIRDEEVHGSDLDLNLIVEAIDDRLPTEA